MSKNFMLLFVLLSFLTGGVQFAHGASVEPTTNSVKQTNDDGGGYYKFYDFYLDGLFYIFDITGVRVCPQFDLPEGEGQPYYIDEDLPKGRIEIPEEVDYDGQFYPVVGLLFNTFTHCKEVTEVILPPTITFIGVESFAGTSITKIELPEGVSLLEKSAFSGCKKLKSVILPKELKAVESNVFAGCTALAKVYCPFSDPAQLDNNADLKNLFKGVGNGKMKLYVPQGAKSKFENAEPWKSAFVEIIEHNPTSVQSVQFDAKLFDIQATAMGMTIGLRQAQQVRVYTLQGLMLYATSLAAGTHQLPLRPGVYLVQVGTQTVKVAVR